jgi:aspartate 1-decarboxylase
MRLRTYVSAKVHGLKVTGKALGYNGSASIPRSLMDAAGLEPYEQVQVVNRANGERFVTYAIPGPEGEFVLNGAAARLGEPGDECLVIAYCQAPEFPGARVAFVDPSDNSLLKVAPYERDGADHPGS